MLPSASSKNTFNEFQPRSTKSDVVPYSITILKDAEIKDDFTGNDLDSLSNNQFGSSTSKEQLTLGSVSSYAKLDAFTTNAYAVLKQTERNVDISISRWN